MVIPSITALNNLIPSLASWLACVRPLGSGEIEIPSSGVSKLDSERKMGQNFAMASQARGRDQLTSPFDRLER